MQYAAYKEASFILYFAYQVNIPFSILTFSNFENVSTL
jgi:hypothetical protein